MKLLLHFILLLLICPQCIYTKKRCDNYLDPIIQKEFGFSGDQLVNIVARRYYFIQRLETSYNALHSFYKKYWFTLPVHTKDSILNIPADVVIHNKLVKISVLRMQQSKILEPLFSLWDELIHYKMLHDEEFIKDFVHIFYIISHNTLLVNSHKHIKNTAILGSILDLSKVAEFIDCCCLNCQHTKHKSEVTINEVMGRFYLLKRLSAAHLIITKQCEQNICLFNYLENNNEIILQNNITFTDPHIIESIKKMVATKSYKSFLRLCDDMASYKFLHSATFMREVLMLYLIVCGQLVQGVQKIDKKNRVNTATMQIVQEMYMQLPNLSIEEILDAIDILTQEVAPLIEEYELNNKELSWKMWIKKYWWMPPMVITVVLVKLYLKSLAAYILDRNESENHKHNEKHGSKSIN